MKISKVNSTTALEFKLSSQRQEKCWKCVDYPECRHCFAVLSFWSCDPWCERQLQPVGDPYQFGLCVPRCFIIRRFQEKGINMCQYIIFSGVQIHESAISNFAPIEFLLNRLEFPISRGNIPPIRKERVTYSLHLANTWSGGFSFDCPIGQSIGELSPCVPRFCYYERDCFVSTQSRTKSTFWGEIRKFFFLYQVQLPIFSSLPCIYW